MGCRRAVWGWLGACVGLLAAGLTPAGPSPAAEPFAFPVRPAEGSAFGMPRVPLEALPPAVRDGARRVVERPTLASHSSGETFTCQPAMYHWLLDHPDQAVRLWRLLGAQVTEIEDRGGGRFGWSDGQGSDIHWDTVLRGPNMRIWYVEGKVKPGLLLPRVAVQAVVLLHWEELRDAQGHPALRHQVHLLLHTDSRTVALAARLLGGSAPRLAEQYLGQLQLFFGGLAWYLDQDADRTARLFARIRPPGAPPAPAPTAPRPAGGWRTPLPGHGAG
jgi:hypothetical protein